MAMCYQIKILDIQEINVGRHWLNYLAFTESLFPHIKKGAFWFESFEMQGSISLVWLKEKMQSTCVNKLFQLFGD